MEEQVRVGPRARLRRGRIAGVRGAWPPPRGCGRDSLGFGGFVQSVSVSDIMGC